MSVLYVLLLFNEVVIFPVLCSVGGRWVNPLTQELNSSAHRCLTKILLRILLLEPRISLIHA
jgi:hypothetical protein